MNAIFPRLDKNNSNISFGQGILICNAPGRYSRGVKIGHYFFCFSPETKKALT